MKLHLPKQLFTALLAAITLAAPAALTLGSSVGAADELGIVKEGNFWANDYTYSFMLQDDAFTNVIADANGAKAIVLSRYYGSSETGELGSNALIAVQDSAGTITLKLGRGQYTSASDSFSPQSQNCVSFDTDVTVKTGVVYTLKVAGATGSMTPTLYGIAAGESDTQSSYNGNMNGDATMQSVFNDDAAILISGSSFVASDDSNTSNVVEGTASLVENNTLVWAGTPAEGAAAWTAESTTWNNISGSANGVAAGAANDVIFDASSATSKTVNLEGALAVNSISVYGDYTLNATAATTLSTTEGLSIAGGKTLTLQGATITLGGTITNNGTLNMAGFTVAANTTTTFGGSGTTTLSGTVTNNGTLNLAGFTVAADTTASISGTGTTNLSGTITNNGTLELSGSNSSGIIKTNAAVTKNADNTVTHTGATINNSGHIDMSGLYISSGGGGKGDVNWGNQTEQYTSLINSIVGGTVLLNSGNLTLQLGNGGNNDPAAVDFRAVYTVEKSTDTADDGSLTLANYNEATLWRVSDGGGLNVNKTLRVANYQDLLIAGGSVTAGDIKLAHDSNDYPGATLAISSGTLKTGTITVEQHRTGTKQTAITMTGGSLEFTTADAITVESTSTAPVVSITGGTLKATVCNWTLNATGWNKTPGVSNVSIDGGNTHNITLKGVNLGGTITNNATADNSGLALENVTVSGSGITFSGAGATTLSGTNTIAGAVTNNGSLTLSGTLDFSGATLTTESALITMGAGASLAINEGSIFKFGALEAGTEYKFIDASDGSTLSDWESITAEQIYINGAQLNSSGYSITTSGGVFSFAQLISSLTWAGSANDGIWSSTSQNWTTGSASSAYVNSIDTSFTSAANVTVAEAITTGNLTIGEANAETGITVTLAAGEGASLAVANGRTLKINNNSTLNSALGIEVSGATVSMGAGAVWNLTGSARQKLSETQLSAVTAMSIGENASLTVNNIETSASSTYDASKLSGSGDLVLMLRNDNGVGFNLSNFEGDIIVKKELGQNSARFQLNTSTLHTNASIILAEANSDLVMNAKCTLSNDVEVQNSSTLHVNGSNEGTITSTISGSGSLTKAGSNSILNLNGSIAVANFIASAGTTNVIGGTVSMLTTTGGTSNVTGGSVTMLTTTGGTSNVTGGTVTTVFSSGGTTNLSTSATGGLVVSGGTVTITGTASIGTDTGTMQVRSDASKNKGIYGHTGTINIGDGTTATTVTTNRVEMGDTEQTANGKGGTLNVNANATLVVTSDAASDAEYGSAGFLLGEWGPSSTMKVAGAVLAKDTAVVNGDQTAIINIENGGLLATKGLGRSNDQGVGVNLTLKDGGKLILGSEGITTVEGFTSTLNAGTVGIYGDSEVSITKDLTLSSATGTTFDTQKYTWTGNSAINRSEGAENGGTLTISGTLSGAGKLIKTGSGELVLSGNNTYTGGTTVQEGELIVSSAGSLGTGSVQLESGSTLTLGASVTNAILVNGAGANINLSSGVTLTQNGKVTINDGASINYTLDSATLNLSGTTVPSGISSIDMKNGSVVQLHSANDILGGENTRVSINMSGNSALSLKNGQGRGLVWADINVDGSGRILGSVNGDSAVVKGSIKGNGSLLLGRSDDTWSNAWKIESLISDNESGKLSVTFDATDGKEGPSKVTLSGANTYSGGTTIENGHLYTENASALGTGKVTVNAGGVLSVAENLNLQDTLQLSGAGKVKVATGKSLNLQDKVSLSSTDGTNAATLTAKSDSALAQLQEDASFTIEDMTLTNTTITAATPTTQVNFSNVTVAGATVLRNMQASMTGANVAAGGSDGVKGEFTASTSLLSGITLANTDAVGSTIVVDLGDLSCAAPMGPGKYDLSITLSGFTMQDYTQGIVFAADSWLGQLLSKAENADVQVSFSEAVAEETPAAVAEGGAATGVTYSTGSVGTVIIITGLNVPEPASATLGLAALTMLCARRRRK